MTFKKTGRQLLCHPNAIYARLAADAYEKYRNKPIKQLKSSLEKVCRCRCPALLCFTEGARCTLVELLHGPCTMQVSKELAPLMHNVNKNALDQYVNFTEQRDDLVRRKQVWQPAFARLPSGAPSVHVWPLTHASRASCNRRTTVMRTFSCTLDPLHSLHWWRTLCQPVPPTWPLALQRSGQELQRHLWPGRSRPLHSGRGQ